jgi:hypothetical protein
MANGFRPTLLVGVGGTGVGTSTRCGARRCGGRVLAEGDWRRSALIPMTTISAG